MKRLLPLLLAIFLAAIPLRGLAQAGNSDVNIGANNPLGISGFMNGDTIYFNNGVFNRLGIGSGSQVLGISGGLPSWVAPGGGGGLTSVGLQMDGVLYPTSVPNSPLTANGTLGPLVLQSQASHTFLGNFGASSAAPTFGTASVSAGTGLTGGGNIMTSPTISLSTPVAVANGGTGVATAPAFSTFCNTLSSSSAPGFSTLSVTTGTGLTGGGNITSSPVISLSTPVAISNGGTGAATVTADTIFGNNTGSTGAPGFNGISSYLDTFGSAEGDILYRGASNWTVLTPGTSGQVLTTQGASALPTWSPTVSSFSSGNLTPLFNTSVATATSTPALSFTAPNQNYLTVYGGSPFVGGAAGAPAFNSYDKALTFGGSSNIRALPTSGAISGDYYIVGPWTQTGTITSTGARIFCSGSMTFAGTFTVNTENGGGAGGTQSNSLTVTAPGGNGAGLGGGSGAGINNLTQVGGTGGSHGGAGGQGGTGATSVNAATATGTYPIYSLLAGSGGGGGSGGGTGGSVGGSGGAGGGSIYIEATGNVTFGATTVFTANGGAGTASGATAGSGAGGSGGGIQVRSFGTLTLTSGGSMTANGGAGGAAATAGAAGGGGGGGIIDLTGAAITQNFTPTASGGAAGSGGVVSATAGSTGIVNTSTVVLLSRCAN